ncbi:MAG: protein arginine kinase [Thermoguttaceae bacterium]|nr:protein arginine kinase [Thermoguttaceae bacterium]
MNLEDLTKRQSSWARGNGPDSDVVISSRIRLARNVAGYPFVNAASDVDLKSVVNAISEVAEQTLPAGSFEILDFANLSREDAELLVERRLASVEFVESAKPRALILDDNESFSAMINEEDHLRLQAVASGFRLSELWRKVDALDDLFESRLSYAFDEKFGYLTACPTNVGTGLRAGIMFHLPGLVETNEIQKVLLSLKKMNFAVRGIYGEGTLPLGELFQASNQNALGISEKDAIRQLEEIATSVVNYERRARETILEKDRDGLLDRCYRALAILRSARLATLQEAMERLSSLRLGVQMNLLDDATPELIDDLIMRIQPIHLRKLFESRGEPFDDDDAARADYLRERLAGVGGARPR